MGIRTHMKTETSNKNEFINESHLLVLTVSVQNRPLQIRTQK